MKRHFEWKLEPRDLWMGVFWDVRPGKERVFVPDIPDDFLSRGRWVPVRVWHVYVCPLPTVLLHWWWERHDK